MGFISGFRAPLGLLLFILAGASPLAEAQAGWLTQPAFGAEPEVKAPLIKELSFEGLLRVEPEAVRLVLGSKPGERFQADQVSKDLRAIYEMSYFSDVRAYTEALDGGVRLIFELREKPAIRKIRIEGNEELSDDDLKNALKLRPFTILNERKLKENAQKFRELANQKGYYLATVETRVNPLPNNQVEVVFNINEKAKVEVRSIRFVGNHHIKSEVLKAGIETREGNMLSFLTEAGTYKKDAFQIDLLRITSAYFDKGFINVKVEPPDAEISPDRKSINITIRIEEGEQFSVRSIAFQGDTLDQERDFERLKKELKLQPGDIFNRSLLGQNLMGYQEMYGDQGYAYANINPLTQIHAEDRTIDLVFDIQKGQKVYYERINVLGNTKTRDKVVRRELRIYEGELSSTSRQELSRRRVTALGYFETVEFKTRRGSSDDLQIVDILIKEKSTGSFQVGAGFSTAENFIATAQISQDNFLGRGQRISLQAQMSSLRQLFQAQFLEPYFLDTEWTLSLTGFNTETQFRSFLRSSTGGDITVGHPITDDLNLYLTYSLEFVHSRGSGGGFTQPAIALLNSKGRISSGRVTLSYDTRDNRLYPSRGMYHSISSELSATWLGATENRSFHRHRILARFYQRLFWKFVGKASFRFGYLHALSAEGLPPSEKFILGGISSVRGYMPYTIGPERFAAYNDRGSGLYDPSSTVFTFVEGGNKEFLANLELEFPLFEAVGLRGVLFMDAGNVFGEDENYFYLGKAPRGSRQRIASDAFNYEKLPLGLFWSVGFGFRWMSPLGQLRFEWGIPLTKRPTDDSGPLFEFGIGNSF